MTRLFAIEDALDTDAWYTPAWVFDGMGVTFDLDVAAPSTPLPWIPARRSYTVADDGLLQPWDGLVWCNPPYSAPTAWCRRWGQHDGGGCLLIRADLSTSGPFYALTAASSWYVPAKRLQFVNGRGGATGAVNFSTILLGRGDIADAALGRLAATSGGCARRLHQPPVVTVDGGATPGGVADVGVRPVDAPPCVPAGPDTNNDNDKGN